MTPSLMRIPGDAPIRALDSTLLLRSAAVTLLGATVALQVVGRFVGPSLVVLGAALVSGLLLPRRPRLAAGIIGTSTAAGLALHAPLIAGPLASPELGPTFVVNLVAVVASLAAVVATPLVLRRRVATGAARIIGGTAVVILVLGTVAAAVLFGTRPQQLPQPGDLVLVTTGTAAAPPVLTAPAGPVTVAVRNDDPLAARSFDIIDLGVHVTVPAATWRRIQFHAPRGQYRYEDLVTLTPETSGQLLVR